MVTMFEAIPRKENATTSTMIIKKSEKCRNRVNMR